MVTAPPAPGDGPKHRTLQSMNLARAIERRLEGLLDGLAARMFTGALHPAELADRLVREADLAETVGDRGPVTANRYVIAVNPRHLPEDSHRRTVAEGLAAVLEDVAAERGWRLEGPVEVELVGDPDLTAATVRCTSEVVPGRRPPWARLVGSGLDVPLVHNRVLIGRSPRCDAVVPDDSVSRRHALLWREGGRVQVEDLDSANGTTVDGRPVEGPAVVEPGSVLGLGAISLRFEPR